MIIRFLDYCLTNNKVYIGISSSLIAMNLFMLYDTARNHKYLKHTYEDIYKMARKFNQS